MKFVLLVFLSGLWSVRLAAMKSAGQSGIPPLVVAPVLILGIALFYSAVAAVRSKLGRAWLGRNRIIRHSDHSLRVV